MKDIFEILTKEEQEKPEMDGCDRYIVKPKLFDALIEPEAPSCPT